MSDLTYVIQGDKFDEIPEGVVGLDVQRWHEFRERYHASQRLELYEPFPLQLDFGLSSSCNYHCTACAQRYNGSNPRKLPFDLFKKAIDEGAEYGICSIKLNHNNEPLLLGNLPEYIEYAKSRGVLNTYIATNGSLLTQEYSRRLILAGLNKIMISLDATTAETYKAMRNSRRFDEVVENIESFINLRDSLGRRNPLLRVNFLRTKINVHEEIDFIKRWDGIADMIGFQDMLGIPGIDNSELYKDGSKDNFRCSFPFKHITISVDGNLLPCCTFSGEKIMLGNLETMTIKEAWNGSIIRDLRELHRQGRYKENPVCAHCVGV